MNHKLLLLICFLPLFILGCPDNAQEPDDTPLTADFSASKLSLVEGQQVTFQDATSGAPEAWSWTFEGGTPATSTERNPVVTYNEAGTYAVSLTLTKGGTTETETKENLVTVVELFSGSTVPAAGPCQVNNVFTNDFVGIGFPNTGPAKSLGTLNVQVLFADFPDAPSSRTTEAVYDIIEPVNDQYFQEMSYGRLEVNLIPHHEWLRLSNNALHYTGGLMSAQGHLAFIQEAVDLADPQVDFSNVDIVVVMANPDAEDIPYGPAFGSLNENFAIQADGNSIMTGVTSGYDLNHWGGIWLSHELGHSLGLPDLYSFGADAHQYVGSFSLMGLISGAAPAFFAYERWLLGWLDDSQIYCHSAGSVAIELEQIATEGGLKAVTVPLSATQVVVIESRRRTGVDASMPQEGVLVYVVDSSVGRGEGPLQIKPGSNSGSMKANAPMTTGETYTYNGVTVEVIESKSSSDVVQVSVQ